MHSSSVERFRRSPPVVFYKKKNCSEYFLEDSWESTYDRVLFYRSCRLRTAACLLKVKHVFTYFPWFTQACLHFNY